MPGRTVRWTPREGRIDIMDYWRGQYADNGSPLVRDAPLHGIVSVQPKRSSRGPTYFYWDDYNFIRVHDNDEHPLEPGMIFRGVAGWDPTLYGSWVPRDVVLRSPRPSMQHEFRDRDYDRYAEDSPSYQSRDIDRSNRQGSPLRSPDGPRLRDSYVPLDSLLRNHSSTSAKFSRHYLAGNVSRRSSSPPGPSANRYGSDADHESVVSDTEMDAATSLIPSNGSTSQTSVHAPSEGIADHATTAAQSIPHTEGLPAGASSAADATFPTQDMTNKLQTAFLSVLRAFDAIRNSDHCAAELKIMQKMARDPAISPLSINSHSDTTVATKMRDAQKRAEAAKDMCDVLAAVVDQDIRNLWETVANTSVMNALQGKMSAINAQTEATSSTVENLVIGVNTLAENMGNMETRVKEQPMRLRSILRAELGEESELNLRKEAGERLEAIIAVEQRLHALEASVAEQKQSEARKSSPIGGSSAKSMLLEILLNLDLKRTGSSKQDSELEKRLKQSEASNGQLQAEVDVLRSRLNKLEDLLRPLEDLIDKGTPLLSSVDDGESRDDMGLGMSDA